MQMPSLSDIYTGAKCVIKFSCGVCLPAYLSVMTFVVMSAASGTPVDDCIKALFHSVFSLFLRYRSDDRSIDSKNVYPIVYAWLSLE